MKNSRPLRSVFIKAAERQAAHQENQRIYSGEASMSFNVELGTCSSFSCNNIRATLRERGTSVWDLEDTPEFRMYTKYFKPEHMYVSNVWWPRKSNGKWNHEARILALLLCAEMLRR